MNCLDAAHRFNQCCPKGSVVEVVLRSGERLSAKTTGAAFVWGGLALVELEGRSGPYQVEHVRPATSESPALAENVAEPERRSA
jgi:hypothetical protein